ncbi:MAG: nucleotidyltransferase domain-containing protein [Armatimonadia bacterium]
MTTLSPSRLSSRDRELAERAAGAIKRHAPDAEVILFGSRAGGTARPDSDFDFLVIADTADRYQLMMELIPILEAVEGLASFDVIVIPRQDWARVRRMPSFVGWQADQYGVRINV